MSEAVRKALEQEAAQLFGAGSWNGVWKILQAYQPTGGDDGIRVYRAILKLSEGQIEKLRHFTAQATMDFRDVLYWAETERT